LGNGKRIRREPLAPWLVGDVRRHCIRCEAAVQQMDRACPQCGLQLRKECPRCHYWVEMDVACCLSCRHSFPPPLPAKATVKLWHERA
jgi:hypothetical protein